MRIPPIRHGEAAPGVATGTLQEGMGEMAQRPDSSQGEPAPVAAASGGALGSSGNILGAATGTAERPAPPPIAAEVPAAVSGVPGGETVVLMEGVSKSFGEATVVKDLQLQVPRGGLIGLIGPSGCGKTTTIRLLLGVYEPSAGEVRVLGELPYRFRRETRERIGYLPQQFVLYPTLTVEENLNFAAAAYGLGPFKRRAAKREVLELVGLTPHRKTLAGKISGGMQRRLGLAATLLHQPDLIFLDEPTAGIDPILREELWNEFRRLQAAGRTQIVTTQYVAEAEYCDWVILMDSGQIVAAGPPDALRQEAAGGDLVDMCIPELDRPLLVTLRGLAGVREVRRLSDDDVRLVVDDAAEIIPQLIGVVQEAGAQVQQIEERRLSFNEVFVALLGRAGRDISEVRGSVE